MKTHAQVVVIGGGLIGCSVLYHLTRLGYTDVVLLERDELTSGSTWHAAAGIHGLHDNNNISRLQYYTMNLYRELEQETGQSCGIHQPGSIYLATTRDRVHQLRIQASKASAFDAQFYEISRAEVAELNPLLKLDGVLCAMYEPLAGHVDPSGVTQAYAQGARNNGALIHRFTPVLETNPRADGGWEVVTPNGNIQSEAVVNVAGLWAREVARLAGLELPLVPMEHQYFVTEAIAEIAALDRELPSVSDRDNEYYLRQEGNGLLVGAYEKDGRFWAEQATPLDFGHELLQGDMDRIADNVMRACERLPVLAEAGIKQLINGPMIWSPDSSALVGPVRGLNNYYLCAGIIPGFSQSAGLGKTVAEWIVHGEPELDMFSWDVARFGAWTTQAFTKARAMDSYSSRFRIHFPNEEREAGRPLKRRPAYELQKSFGAVFGLSYGWEHPHWFAPPGIAQQDEFSFERPAWFEVIGQEAGAVRESVGLLDTSNFAKYEITGPNAAAWLDRILANHIPAQAGRMCLAPLLGLRGGVAGDFTVSRLSQERLFMIGSGIAEDYHLRIFERYLPAAGVEFRSVTDQMAGISIAGPRSREVMEVLCRADFSSPVQPFMRARLMEIAGHPAIVLRVSFTGDLGYEIYIDQSAQLALYQSALEAGKAFGMRPVGSRALASLRIEKGYGSWGREYSPEWYPAESGLAGLVKADKPEFAGKQAWLAVGTQSPRQRLCCFTIESASAADAWGGEVILRDGKYVGLITSGSYSFTFKTSVALGYVNATDYDPQAVYQVAVLGVPQRARLLQAPLFDPLGKRLRG